MGTFLQLSMVVLIIFSCGWYSKLQHDPYSVCVDHPDPKMSETHYLCQPFDLELEKKAPGVKRGAVPSPLEGAKTKVNEATKKSKTGYDADGDDGQITTESLNAEPKLVKSRENNFEFGSEGGAGAKTATKKPSAPEKKHKQKPTIPADVKLWRKDVDGAAEEL